MKRYKNTEEVVHAWAGRHSNDGTNPGQTCYFVGLTIYSYGSHFPMARHISFNDVLLTYATYSNTTSRHQHHTWRAVSHKNTLYVMDVEDPLGAEGVTSTIDRAEGFLRSAAKRKLVDRRNKDIHEAWQCVENLYEIAAFDDFKADWKKLDGKLKRSLGSCRKLIAAAKVDAVGALAKMTAKQKAADARAKRLRDKQRREETEKCKQSLEDWLSGKVVIRQTLYRCRDLLGTDGLRLEAETETVYTTQGLAVPAADCWKAWPFIKRAYRSGQEYVLRMDQENYRFGNFRMDRIEASGMVVVGCHRFKREIVERLAASLELHYADKAPVSN